MSTGTEERAETASVVSEDGSESLADEAGDDEDIRAHLADVEDGCGCAEVWEHLSSGRGE